MQFSESAVSLINSSKYNEALHILKAIIIQEKSAKKIFPMIQKAQCEIESDRKSKAENTSKEIANLMATKEFENESVDTKTKSHDKLKPLYKKLIEINKCDTALQLIRLQFDLIKQSYQPEEKLDRLCNLGDSLKDMAENFHFQKNAAEAKEHYFLLDKILHDMQIISVVEFTRKTKIVSWFMFYYGLCCNNMGDFEKSLNIHSNVIFFMKSNLGESARNYQLYGDCHHNFAVALLELNRLNEAKQKFEEALKIYDQVEEWVDEEQKMEVVLNTTRMMDKIIRKLNV